jgi:hypothetical protein
MLLISPFRSVLLWKTMSGANKRIWTLSRRLNSVQVVRSRRGAWNDWIVPAFITGGGTALPSSNCCRTEAVNHHERIVQHDLKTGRPSGPPQG